MTTAFRDTKAAPASPGGPDAAAGAWCDRNPLCPLAVFLRVLGGEPISAVQASLPDHLDAKEGFVSQAEAILPHLDRRLPGGVRVTARRPNGFRALEADCLRILECHPELRLTGPLPPATAENRARYRASRERAERAARLHEQGLSWTQIAARIGVIRESARHIVLQHESALRHCAELREDPVSAHPAGDGVGAGLPIEDGTPDRRSEGAPAHVGADAAAEAGAVPRVRNVNALRGRAG